MADVSLESIVEWELIHATASIVAAVVIHAIFVEEAIKSRDDFGYLITISPSSWVQENSPDSPDVRMNLKITVSVMIFLNCSYT